MPLLIIDDLGMRKLPASAAEDHLEIVMRRCERASTIITSNRPLEDWPRMFGDTPAVTAFLDRLMHHSHLIQLRGKSSTTRVQHQRPHEEGQPVKIANRGHISLARACGFGLPTGVRFGSARRGLHVIRRLKGFEIPAVALEATVLPTRRLQ